MEIKQERNTGKKSKKGRITLTSRFYALMCTVLGILSIFIFKAIGETDMTGPVFVILMGTLAYIGSFGEDD